MINYLIIFFVSLAIVTATIPSIISVSLRKRLFDVPSEPRKIHKRIVPNLGGIAIFLAIVLTQMLFVRNSASGISNFLLAAALIIFSIGLKDDLVGLDPFKKFIAQFAAAFIVTILADIRIKSLDWIFGLTTLSYPFSIALSVFVIVGVINAFNLIDGVDGLAGTLGVIMSLTFAMLFYSAGKTDWTCLSVAIGGAFAGFLIFNISPAKIFMGDSGSLTLGFFSSILGVEFMNISELHPISIGLLRISSAPALVVAILLVPMFDTIRVFTLRILNNTSPFRADRNHIHHRLLSIGMSHTQVTLTLSGITILFIATAFYFQSIGNNQLIATLVIMIVSLNTGFTIYLHSRNLRLGRMEEEITEAEVKPITLKIAHDKQDASLNDDMVKKVAKN